MNAGQSQADPPLPTAGGGSGAGGSSAAGSGAAGASAGGDAAFLDLAQPARGFRVASKGREILPQSDVEFCEVAELPGTPEDEYIVNEIESANARGSHHLIVSVALPGSVADENLRKRPLGEQVPCIGAGSEFGQQGMMTIAGSQTLYNKANYPQGVAIRLRGGQRVVFDYHYFNFGAEPLMAKSAIAVHALEPGTAVTIATNYAFTNMTLDTPPGTTKTFTASCTFENDAIAIGVGRHTHKKGTDFTVWFEGGARHGQQIWSSDDWEHDTTHAFDEPLLIKAGEGFKFSCSFENDTEKPLRFGIASTDEMCILTGAIWSPTPGVEIKPESCVISWVDDQGLGHDARDAGGFPKATADDALACYAGSLGIGLIEGCVGCICDSCATIMARCSADVDCKALLDCTSANMGSGNVNQACEQEMFDHSSAVGMITQVGLCLQTSCGTPCSIPTPTM